MGRHDYEFMCILLVMCVICMWSECSSYVISKIFNKKKKVGGKCEAQSGGY